MNPFKPNSMFIGRDDPIFKKGEGKTDTFPETFPDLDLKVPGSTKPPRIDPIFPDSLPTNSPFHGKSTGEPDNDS